MRVCSLQDSLQVSLRAWPAWSGGGSVGRLSIEAGAAHNVRHRRAIQSAGVIGNAATPACARPSLSPLQARRDCRCAAASRRHRALATAPLARSRGPRSAFAAHLGSRAARGCDAALGGSRRRGLGRGLGFRYRFGHLLSGCWLANVFRRLSRALGRNGRRGFGGLRHGRGFHGGCALGSGRTGRRSPRARRLGWLRRRGRGCSLFALCVRRVRRARGWRGRR